MDDFPEKDTFQDYRGKEVTFTYHLLDAGNIYSLRAVEVTRRRHPRTFCVYDAPSPEAIRKSAIRNELPVDEITQVRVLDPYFYA